MELDVIRGDSTSFEVIISHESPMGKSEGLPRACIAGGLLNRRWVGVDQGGASTWGWDRPRPGRYGQRRLAKYDTGRGFAHMGEFESDSIGKLQGPPARRQGGARRTGGPSGTVQVRAGLLRGVAVGAGTALLFERASGLNALAIRSQGEAFPLHLVEFYS